MYRTIIVDDEKWALAGIRKYLNMIPGAFDMIGETTSPSEALEMIAQKQPDIVFTDYRMPGMTGTEMIQRAKAVSSHTEFVVISGYSDFEYVQQALRVGALDYLLKPLDVLNANTLLKNILDKMNKGHLLDDLDLFSQLVVDRGSQEEMMRFHLPKPLMPCWQVACVERTGDEKVMLELDAFSSWQGKVLKIGPKKLMWIINSTEDCQPAIEQAVQRAKNLVACCGISPSVREVEKLPALIRMAEDSMWESFVYPDQHIFRYRHPHPSKVFSLWEQYHRLLQDRKMNAVIAALHQLPEEFRRQHLTLTDAVSLWNLFVDNGTGDRPDTMWDDGLSHMRPHTMAETLGSIDTMTQYLIDFLSDQPGEQDGSTGQHFKKLLQYIDTHYMENLNLQALSNQYYINVSYCCELFKKETGMTFTQYMTKLRMTHAQELLLGSDLPLKLVCENIGYNDYFYFDKVFKRNTGLTPTEYRKQYGKK